MSIIKHVTLQKIVAHDFRYDPRTFTVAYFPHNWLRWKFFQKYLWIIYAISDCQSSEYLYYSLLGYDTVYVGRQVQKLRSNLLPLPSGAILTMEAVCSPVSQTKCHRPDDCNTI